MPYNRVSASGKSIWKNQLPIDYIDTSLTINTFETVSSDLSEGKPTQLIFIIVEQTNNGAAAEDIELEVTINGVAYTWTLTGIASGVKNYLYITKDLTTGDFTTSSHTNVYSVGSSGFALQDAAPFTAKSVGLIRTRQTTGVDGTSAQIEVNIVWRKLVNA